jgi:type I restriction enzyme, S subunit
VSELVIRPLGDCLSLLIDHRGRTPKKLGADFTSAGVPVISAKNVKNGRLSLNAEVRYVPVDLFERWMSDRLRAGDVLLTSEAPLGEAAFLKDDTDYCLGQRLFALRADETKVHPRFLYYLLRSPRARQALEARATGTTAQGIRQAELVKVELEIPPLTHQQEAAALLGSLDDKIDLNNEMSNTLEEIARSIFKSWFVDFEPVRAKMLGHKPRGVETDTATLFPDRLVSSSRGRIPEGWQVSTLGELTHDVRGRSYRSSELSDSRTALVTLKSFRRGGGYRRDGLKAFTGSYKQEQVVAPGEVVIACTDVTQAAEVVGRPAVVLPDDRFDTLVASLDVVILRSKAPDLSAPYLYFLTGTEEFTSHAYAHTSGTTVLHLDRRCIAAFSVVCPPPQLLSAYSEISEPMFQRIQENATESVLLARIRDALLARLVSGELELKEAERVFEAAV